MFGFKLNYVRKFINLLKLSRSSEEKHQVAYKTELESMGKGTLKMFRDFCYAFMNKPTYEHVDTRQRRRKAAFDQSFVEVNKQFFFRKMRRDDVVAEGYTLPRSARRKIARNRLKVVWTSL